MHAPLVVPDNPTILRHLGDTLRAEGYQAQNLMQYLGTVEIPHPDSPELARMLYRTRAGTPLDTLARLLLIGEPVPATAAKIAFGAIPIESLAGMGLFRIDGDTVHPGVVVFPYRDLLLVCDAPPEMRPSENPDVAVGVTESSIVLELLTIRRKARRTLDLGCGCGVQSFIASAHSDEVVGIDSVARCIASARISAGVNRCHRATFVQGDGFEPVRGQRFDLIVSNLPFVIAPSFRYHYSDSGHALDDFPKRIVSEAPSLLEEGGYCQLLCEWIHPRGEDWRERLARWFAGSGCDVWAIPIETRTPEAYAEDLMPNRPPEQRKDGPRQYAEWLAYYDQHGVEAITTGAIMMRRRAGANWTRIDDTPEWSRAPASNELLMGFGLRDFVEDTSTADLLAHRLRVNEQARLTQRLRRENASWVTDSAEIRFDGGFFYAGKVDRWISGLLALADGSRTLGAIMAQLAAQAGYPAEKFTAAFLPIVRQLIERGFLLPASKQTG